VELSLAADIVGVMAKRTATVVPPQTISLKVLHNGRPLAHAAIPGFAVLSAHVTWVRRDTTRFPPGSKVEAEELLFRVGGLDSNDLKQERHVSWATPPLAVGDRVEIQISDDPGSDPPTSYCVSPRRRRPAPPPPDNPARLSVRDAVAWPAPRGGVHIKALDERRGGPVTLTKEEALRLARGLTKMARDVPPARPRKRDRAVRKR